ncbi:hypothetical protein WJX72_004180 [[Myrmecia] bisecta]|uniref:Uncharacterized protein n=1 Tax=[Myrmecia] bisecta TaxID=41462 RepID=A0AAW1PJM0_9CHLO
MATYDSDYLKRTVGDSLSRGCAAVVAANPADPVEYLGLWLLRCVKNAEVEDKRRKQLAADAAAEKALQERLAAAEAKRQAWAAEKQAALDSLASASTDLWDTWHQACAVCTKYTGASAAYVASVEEAPLPLPEATPEDADFLSHPSVAGAPGGEAAGGSPPADEDDSAADADPAAASKPKFDYSSKFLQYVVGSQGQGWVGSSSLRRPAAPTEEEEEAGKAKAATPLTFRLLDEGLPSLYIPNVAYERNITFFNRFPRVGAYLAAALPANGAEPVRAVLGLDSLLPPGSGQPLSEEDRDYIAQTAGILGRAMSVAEERRRGALAGGTALAQLEALEVQLQAPTAPDTSSAAPADQASPDAAAPSEGATEAAPAPVDEVQVAMAAAANEEAAWAAIKAALAQQSSAGVAAMRQWPAAPCATMHTLQALLLLLGVGEAQCDTWAKCRALVDGPLIARALEHNADIPLERAVWQGIKAHLSAVAGKRQQLVEEMPETCLGVLIVMALKHLLKLEKARTTVRRQQAAAQAAKEAAAKAEAEAAAAAEAAAQAQAPAVEAEAEGEAGAAAEAAA